MGTEKRERQKANRAAKQEAEAKAKAKAKRLATIRTAIIAGVIIVIVMLIVSLAGCGSAASGSEGDQSESAGTAACPPVDGADEPVVDFDGAPPMCIDPAKSYTATIETTAGTVEVQLDTARTPETTNNFVTLARYGYYDQTDLFRTEDTTGIIQGGAPHTQGPSDPGPGYTIDDEGQPYSSDDYGPGAIAMANTGLPNSAGAQFFLLANEGGTYLGDPATIGEAAGTYAVFGQVTEGLDVLETIAELDDGAGRPSRQVTVESVTIAET